MGLRYTNQGHCFESLASNACCCKNYKSKDHLKSLERRFEIWKEGNINELYKEGKSIQDRLNGIPYDIVKISKKFKLQMQKGNVNGAFRLLISNIIGGILPLTD